MITLTESAAIQLNSILEQKGLKESHGLRVFVKGGGCGGMAYGMTFVEEPLATDCVLEKDGMKIYIDAIALSFLEGVEIDYKTQGMNRSFVFKNVFANTGGAGTCSACGAAGGGCG